MTDSIAAEVDWMGSIRALAGVRVAVVRERWMSRGRSNTVHDAIDDILLPPDNSPQIADAVAAARRALAGSPKWVKVANAFALDAHEIEFLALLCVCEIDSRLPRLLGYLADSDAIALPSPSTAQQFWGWPDGYQPGPASPLVRWQLASPFAGEGWHATTSWSADPAIASILTPRQGDDPSAPFWPEAARSVADRMPCLFPELLEEMRSATAAIIEKSAVSCEVELVGALGSGRRTLLTQLSTALGRTSCIARGAEGVIGLRSAMLAGSIPIWVEDPVEYSPPAPIDDRTGAIRMVVREVTAAAADPATVQLSWAVPAPAREHRAALWKSLTKRRPPFAVKEWMLTPAEIVVAAAAAPAGPSVGHAVLQRKLRSTALQTMTQSPLPYGWNDLVVTPSVDAALRRFHSTVVLGGAVLDEWEFRRLVPAGSGATALFAGPSGTGKTMAAQVLARELELDLFRVDLAEVVSKYIGETEKRLAQVFAECERSRVMVLFDEADALFGKRTAVREAHDRFANIEIDYLLQRMETFSGVAILATNRKNDLDSAFTRRIRTIVDFAAPARAERLALWKIALPALTSTGQRVTDNLDLEWLAIHLELTGAEIKSIALDAAFQARSDGTLIDNEIVLEAARREFAKRGDVVRASLPTRAEAS